MTGKSRTTLRHPHRMAARRDCPIRMQDTRNARPRRSSRLLALHRRASLRTVPTRMHKRSEAALPPESIRGNPTQAIERCRDAPIRRDVDMGNTSRVALAALALGAAAAGAVAVGALAIGALAIGRLVVRRGRVRRLDIDELSVGELRIEGRSSRNARRIKRSRPTALAQRRGLRDGSIVLPRRNPREVDRLLVRARSRADHVPAQARGSAHSQI